MTQETKVEVIVAGEFRAAGIDGEAEARLSDEASVSSAVLRKKEVVKQLEAGATYELVLRKVADAPAPATVTVTMRAEDVGGLPNSAVIEKGKENAGGNEASRTADEGTEQAGSGGGSET